MVYVTVGALLIGSPAIAFGIRPATLIVGGLASLGGVVAIAAGLWWFTIPSFMAGLGVVPLGVATSWSHFARARFVGAGRGQRSVRR